MKRKYFKLSTFQEKLQKYVNNAKDKGLWRENAVQLTERYLNEGLHDRAVSRDLSIGVPVPVKAVYVPFACIAEITLSGSS